MTAQGDLRVGHGPTRVQGLVLIGGLVGAVVVCAVILLRTPEPFLPWVKSGSAILLLAAALLAPRRHPAFGWVVAAFGASAAGDLFLTVIHLGGGLSQIAGMGLFAVAYLLLTVAFWRGRFVAYGLRYLATYGLVGAALVYGLWPRLEGVMRIGLPAFVVVIVVMAWSAATTPTRGVFSRRVGELFAIGAGTLVASDAAVAFVMFSPPPDAWQVPVDAFVRVTYFVGWLLFLLAILDPEPSASGLAAVESAPTTRPVHHRAH